MATTNVRFSDLTYDRIKLVAKLENRSINSFIENVMYEYCDDNKITAAKAKIAQSNSLDKSVNQK